MAWNNATDEFGISYSGYNGSVACGNAPFVGFVRLRAGDGFLFPRTIFGCSAGTYFTDIAVNTNTGRFVMGWSPGGGILFQEFDAAGNGTANTGLMSGVFGGNDNFSIDFNPVSGTFLGVGQHVSSYEIAGVEANTSGFPIGVAAVLTSGGAAPGSYHPTVAGRNDSAYWGISYARQFNMLTDRIIGTASTGGGPSGPPGADTNTDASTHGRLHDAQPVRRVRHGRVRQWRLGLRHASPSARTSASACTDAGAGTRANWLHDAEPVCGLRDGVCVNGGWQFGAPAPAPAPPPPAPTPTPPPAPAPTGCTTPNPFANFGMGACVNGGWIFAPSQRRHRHRRRRRRTTTAPAQRLIPLAAAASATRAAGIRLHAHALQRAA